MFCYIFQWVVIFGSTVACGLTEDIAKTICFRGAGCNNCDDCDRRHTYGWLIDKYRILYVEENTDNYTSKNFNSPSWRFCQQIKLHAHPGKIVINFFFSDFNPVV